MSSPRVIKRNSQPKCILRLHEAKITNPKYKIDRCHKNFYVEAEKYWNKPENGIENKKYWNYSVDNLVHGISQEEMFRRFFLLDTIVREKTTVKIANSLIMCMGGTGKGKSYTMFGLNETYENRGFALRIIKSLFQLKEHYNRCKIKMYISAVEHFQDQCYDLLVSPKVIVYNRRETNKILIESEEYVTDLISQINSMRNVEKAVNDSPVHHTSSVAVEFSIEISCVHSSYKYTSKIFLVDLEAFDHVRSDNVKTIYSLNRKFMNIRNFATFIVKVIGTSDSTSESVLKTKSLMCSMKTMQKFIAQHSLEESSVFTQEENSDMIKLTLQNRVDEMHGVIKLAKDRQTKTRNPNVIRETYDYVKRLILAYVHDKLEEVFIINMNVAPDIQFLFNVCMNLYEPLKLNYDMEMAEVEREVRLEYLKKKNVQMEEESSNDEVEEESANPMEMEAHCLRHPSRLRNECVVKMEPLHIVWEEFLKIEPSLKFSLDYYCKEHNSYQGKLKMIEQLLANEKYSYGLNDHQREEYMIQMSYLDTQITLTRKKIAQIHSDNRAQFSEFCRQNDFIALPEALDVTVASKSSIFTNPSKIFNETAELKNADIEAFHKYLRQIIKNSELATILTGKNQE